MTSSHRSRSAGYALLAALLVPVAPARAAEPQGCGGFRWSLDAERQAMSTAATVLPSGTTVAAPVGIPFLVETRPFAEAELPQPPERAPRRPDGRAAFLRVAQTVPPGPYQIAISEPAWLDVVQDGRTLKPTAFTGAEGCPGIRKAIRVDLDGTPLTLILSDVPAPRTTVLITRVGG